MTLPVSAVMAVRDGERYISAALFSVLAERVRELVIVDDGSSDDTLAIVNDVLTYREESAPRVIVVSESIGVGLGAARNLGLRHATMPYIAMIDADDLWVKGKTKKQIDALTKMPHPCYSSTLVDHFVEPGCTPPGTFGPDKLGTIRLNVPSNLLAHRDVFGIVGGFDPMLPSASDVDWFQRAHQLGVRRVEVPEVLMRKRVHDRNLSLDEREDRRGEVVSVLTRKVTPSMFSVEGY